MRRNKKLTLGVLKRVSSLQALPVICGNHDTSGLYTVYRDLKEGIAQGGSRGGKVCSLLRDSKYVHSVVHVS